MTGKEWIELFLTSIGFSLLAIGVLYGTYEMIEAIRK